MHFFCAKTAKISFSGIEVGVWPGAEWCGKEGCVVLRALSNEVSFVRVGLKLFDLGPGLGFSVFGL